MANQMVMLGGRTLDEFTIMLSIALNAYLEIDAKRGASGDLLMERYQYHADEWKSVQADFVAAAQELAAEVKAS